MRLIGCALLMMAVAAPAFAGEHYVEIWNPPEAHTGAPQPHKPSRKSARHRHRGPRVLQARTRTAPGPALTTKPAAQEDSRDGRWITSPNLNDLPQPVTPDGSVLRVDAAGRTTIEVTR